MSEIKKTQEEIDQLKAKIQKLEEEKKRLIEERAPLVFEQLSHHLYHLRKIVSENTDLNEIHRLIDAFGVTVYKGDYLEYWETSTAGCNGPGLDQMFPEIYNQIADKIHKGE